MVGKFQCVGCVGGCEPSSENVKEIGGGAWACERHVPGTLLFPVGKVMLGLPKGFNRVRHRLIRLWPGCGSPNWDDLNVPVWAMEKDCHLFVRTYSPRINVTWVDVVEGGTIGMTPSAIDVSKFVDEID
jgi:hypothetical protein